MAHKTKKKPSHKIISPHFILTLALLLIPIIGGILLFTKNGAAKETTPAPIKITHCVGNDAFDFQCYKKHFAAITEVSGPKVATDALKNLYAHNSYVVSQCHQLVHVIGNTAAERYGDIGEAFRYGDSFCWSGYYHGVVEQALKQFNPTTVAAKTNEFCARIPGKETYSFDYFNCVHGLGHGFMTITKIELFDALNLCDNLTGNWEKESCYGGVYMENVMADNSIRNHSTKYLKADDLLYPCNAVEEHYKGQCYLMQTSYALTKNGRDFANLFDLCARAESNYRNICVQSIGRDASGQSVSNADQTHAWCALGHDQNQKENCIIGAAKDFVSYFHSDTQAYKLCELEKGTLRTVCEGTVASYYHSF